ncbi:DUF58 domain-containing protein [Haladaptatus pallidirubidus]|uniref:DUF58 domain-containing protein n=1 Tax=Haladaptatus pallidirubidus TaxID=1008152 RepID=A0AAV3UHD1_9EURY|nr:DUF58 domain-containing protein [Haladaptatus pallidirubidus]
MKPTRRYWAGVGVVCFLAGGAWILKLPLLLIGAGGIGAILLSSQFVFLLSVLEIKDSLEISQRPVQSQVSEQSDIDMIIHGSLPKPTTLEIQIEAQPPKTATGIRSSDLTATVAIDESETQTTATFHCPIATRLQFRMPTVTLTDRAGFFQSSFEHGSTATVTVTPNRVESAEIGADGQHQLSSLGEHKHGKRGTGLEPAEVRQYVPGDTAQRIDWKVTARLSTPHVRDFEAEAELQTYLFMDHRQSMFAGSAETTKYDFAREVALQYITHARTASESLGLTVITDDQVVDFPPKATPNHFIRLQNYLYDQTPAGTKGTHSNAQFPIEQLTAANSKSQQLQSRSSPFAKQLFPLLNTKGTRIQRVKEDPLYQAVRSQLKSKTGIVQAVLVTDDSNRVEVYETVKLARQWSDSVTLFLIPSVLFEEGSIAEVEDAYQRYRDFGQLQQSLSKIDGVTVFEVGPKEQLENIPAESHQSSEQQVPQ